MSSVQYHLSNRERQIALDTSRPKPGNIYLWQGTCQVLAQPGHSWQIAYSIPTQHTLHSVLSCAWWHLLKVNDLAVSNGWIHLLTCEKLRTQCVTLLLTWLRWYHTDYAMKGCAVHVCEYVVLIESERFIPKLYHRRNLPFYRVYSPMILHPHLNTQWTQCVTWLSAQSNVSFTHTHTSILSCFYLTGITSLH